MKKLLITLLIIALLILLGLYLAWSSAVDQFMEVL